MKSRPLSPDESFAGANDDCRRSLRRSLRTLCVGKPIAKTICLLVLSTFFGFADPTFAAEAIPIDEPPITGSDREHWSFRPLTRPEVPGVRNRTWPRTIIDRFILARLEAEGITPQVEAHRTTLIRRVYFDLIGLPPTPREVDRFVADASPMAYENLVDRLLGSPHYGERWGQHWLDLARFAETDGFEHDKVRPTAWKYRDWVVRAFNSDMPFDRFTHLQLAGDLIEPDNAEAQLATAFCCSGPDMPDINSQQERKHVLLNEVTSTVGSVFLGLTLGCAQCHNHMYDPISQADFYRLRAFFDPAIDVVRDKSITMLKSNPKSGRDFSHLMIRGDWRRTGPEVSPDFLRVVDYSKPTEVTDIQLKRRRHLAKWLTDARHPLTARVFVNRVWQYHFGRGLSETPSDFGVMGMEPSHPRLLNWLASEFSTTRWQIKRLQRTILISAVYRQKSYVSSADADYATLQRSVAVDPRCNLLSRFPRRRLDAELIRDAMLAVANVLDTRIGGPGVKPPLPAEMAKTLLRNQWNPSSNLADRYRRSIYIFARRNLRYPIFSAFDRPAANSSCAMRPVSTTAPQALLMLNSKITLDAARHLAASVIDAAGAKPTEQVTECYRRVFGRFPTAAEKREALGFLEHSPEGRTGHATDPVEVTQGQVALQPLSGFCLALLNSSEFFYVD